jgi:hypothetical protein
MHADDIERFAIALNELAATCTDPMDEVRQRGYWRRLHDQMSIEEWEYACLYAPLNESFHKVPMPGVLLDYVRDMRKALQHRVPLTRSLEVRNEDNDRRGLESLRAIMAKHGWLREDDKGGPAP